MKKVLLESEIIGYLQREILRVRKSSPKVLCEIREESFAQGYKAGEIAALERVLRDVWMNKLSGVSR